MSHSPLVCPNKFFPVLVVSAVNGASVHILVSFRSDDLLDLFVLLFVEVPGNRVLEGERYPGILQKRAVLGVNEIFRNIGAATEIDARALPTHGPPVTDGFPDPRVVVQAHINLHLRPLSGNVLVELEGFLTCGASFSQSFEDTLDFLDGEVSSN